MSHAITSAEPSSPKVLNRYKDRCLGAVYIGRPTRWGNPFVMGKDGTREEVVQKFAEWIKTQPELLALVRKELKGRDLVCFCSPKACHGDVLIKLANEESDLFIDEPDIND